MITLRIYLDNCTYNRPYDDPEWKQKMVVDNIAVTADRCMEAILEQVGTVELGAFIYYV